MPAFLLKCEATMAESPRQVTNHHTSQGATQNVTDTSIDVSSPMEFSSPPNGSVGYNTSSSSSYDSTSTSDSPSSFEGIGYNLPDLLRRKKKNTKSSEAQNFLHYTVREAAKTAGLWKTAPYMQDISTGQMKVFYEAVFASCPQLRTAKNALRKRLSDTLMNRTAHLRSLQLMSPVKRGQRKRSAIVRRHLFADTPSHCSKLYKTSDSLKPGSEVYIFKDTQRIGRGVFLSAENSMYGKVLLLKNSCPKDEEIELQEACNGKVLFNKLKEKDIFLWKLQQIKSTSPSASKESMGGTTTISESSEEPEDNSVSEYELARLKRIKENKGMWQELMKDLIPPPKKENKRQITSKKGGKNLNSRKLKEPSTSSKEQVMNQHTPKKVCREQVMYQHTPKKVPSTSSREQVMNQHTPKKVLSTSSREQVMNQHTPKKAPSTSCTEKMMTQHAPNKKTRIKPSWEYQEVEANEQDHFTVAILDGRRSRKPKIRDF